ncbi:hypothetical protein A6J71_07895 [Enterobacter cancerogenus]|uniref:Uncharacterized protein n=1 Tax=Enterobacter cancerogenus TaxID=69218 RepID=A0AB38P753_9ENTR|nr:hypothetical protein A6J71_07895 [Enterobacter cancerogenus]TKK20479.1 hypothetical protein EcCFBP13530_08000 [Enterobacter cancerogenus]
MRFVVSGGANAYPTYGLVGPVSAAPPGKTAISNHNQRNTISSASTTTAPMLMDATYQRR